MTTMHRRAFGAGAAATVMIGCASLQRTEPMYGLIGKMKSAPGKRGELASILLAGVSGMPGCRSYVVAEDPADADTLWITEAWSDAASHQASLSSPSVQEAIRQARPIIASMETVAETRPIGGHGL